MTNSLPSCISRPAGKYPTSPRCPSVLAGAIATLVGAALGGRFTPPILPSTLHLMFLVKLVRTLALGLPSSTAKQKNNYSITATKFLFLPSSTATPTLSNQPQKPIKSSQSRGTAFVLVLCFCSLHFHSEQKHKKKL